MLEIYNEKIQDLLIPLNSRPIGGLKVREHKKCGIYVEELTKYAVDSYEAIERKIEIGNTNRTIGATLMNASSSRAHTIISIEFKQKKEYDKKKIQKLSVINLVDLAGSEKVGKSGATGDRMKEGLFFIYFIVISADIFLFLLKLLLVRKKKNQYFNVY